MTQSRARPDATGPYEDHPPSGQYAAPSQVRLRAQPTQQTEAEFVGVLRSVRDAPEDFGAWDTLELLCEALQRPDPVADAYLRMLTPARPDTLREELGRRAVRFYDSWYGDDEAAMRRVLDHVIETCPDAGWAFDQLVSELTDGQHWDSLLEAYDRALLGRLAPARRRQLLDDAAHVAKDFTDRPERAIEYLRELLRLDPSAHALCASLERVLSERKAWQPLIGLWQAQLEATPESLVSELRLRIARVYLDHLSAPAEALHEAAGVLERRPGDDQACALLERVLALPEADVALRLSSLQLLRLHHDSADRPLATIAALERSLSFAPDTTQLGLRRELAARLMARFEDRPAMAHYAEALRAEPSDGDARLQLERLAERSGEHAAHAEALVSAAEAAADHTQVAQLLIAAMAVHAEPLAQRDAAIALGQRVLTLANAQPAQLREAAGQLERLLRGTGRTIEQLAVLDRLAQGEASPYRRRLLLSEIAQHAHETGDLERALGAWQTWLAYDAADLEALSASIELAAQLGRHDLEVTQLQKRAEVAPTPRQRRQDRTRVATLQATALRDLDAAIDTWLSVREEFGDEPDLLQALDELMTESKRFCELARIFEGATDRERTLSVARLCRLGDVHRLELEDHGAAARAYGRALELEPGCAAARSGLSALLGIKGCAQEVTSALSQAYIATDDWQLRIDLLDARLAATDDPTQQALCMFEVAQLWEQRAADPSHALTLVAKALPRAPADVHAQRELLRLAELTGHLREAASALHWAALAASFDRPRAADLSAAAGRLFERLNDYKRAAEAYEVVLAVHPLAPYEAHALVRCAALAGSYRLACDTALHSCAVRSRLEPVVLESLASAATAASAFPSLCEAFALALRSRSDLAPALHCELSLQLASWRLEQCADAPGAEVAAQRALKLQPNSAQALSMLAAVQRLAPTQALFETLLTLDAQSPDTLAPLIEAAQLLIELNVDAAHQRATLARLYRRAADLWTREGVSGDFERWVLWAVERLVPLELAAKQAARALYLLDDAVRLPLSEAQRAGLRRQSARILEQEGQLSEALHVGLSVLPQEPRDRELVSWLATLAQRLERVPEQLALRKRELALSDSVEARLTLRLEIVRLTGLLEERDARLVMLLGNLEEHAGHHDSLEAACALLTEKHRLPELFSLLAKQARAVAEAGQDALAITLWQEAAELSEEKLQDREQAIYALEQVAALSDDAQVLDELVRLCRALEDQAGSARWLARRLTLTDATERPRVLHELAQAQLAAQQVEAALETLHTAFAEAPADLAVRTLLTEQLRAGERYAELAGVLARAAGETQDRAESATLAIESARLYHSTLENPEALVAVADLALGLQPDDAELCGIMADGLRALGRFDEARQVLMYLLAQFGRRRSSERAAVHVKLADILRDEGDLSESCAQLELALNMRSADVAIMYALSERAAEAGDLARRERALRSLLLAAKRTPIVLATGRTLGVSEVLLELSELALTRGDSDQASSLRESALEALRFGDPECERIKQSLRERGTPELLEQIVRQELAHAVSHPERALAMNALADLLQLRPQTRDESIELRLAAIELDPSDPRLHDAAQTACTPDCLPRFRALLERLRERARRPSDRYARCEVCLRLGALYFAEDNIDGAQTLFSEAEATHVRESDVWRAQLRVAVAREAVQAQTTLLSKLDGLGGAELPNEERVDVLYRLAEVRLAAEDTRNEGLARMRDALAEAPRPMRAARVLLNALSEQAADSELLALFADVARDCSEPQLLQVSALCAEEGNAAALGILLERADAAGSSPELRAALLVKRACLLLTNDATDQEAGELLCKAVALRPDDIEAENRLISYFQESAAWDRLLDHLALRFEQTCADGAVDACVRYALALHLHVEEGAREAQAVRALRQALMLAPHHDEVRSALLVRLAADEHAHERAEVLEQMLAHRPIADGAELSIEAASLYETCGDVVAALRVLRTAHERAPQHAGIVLMLTEILRRQDDAQALAELLAESARNEGDVSSRVRTLREAAQLQRARLDDHGTAATLLLEAVEALPDDSSLRKELALDLFTLGRMDEASGHLAHAAAHCDDDEERASLLHLRGKTLLQQSKLEAGLADLQAAFALAATSLGSDLLQTLEDARLLALEAQDEAAERDLTFRMASMRRSLGDLPEAAQLIETWLGRGTASDEGLSMLSELYTELSWSSDLARILATRLCHVTDELRTDLAQQLTQLIPQLDDVAEVRAALTLAHGMQPESLEIEETLISALTAVSDDLSIAELLMKRAPRLPEAEARTRCMSRAVQHFLDAGAATEATEVLQQLHSAAPGDIDIGIALADALIGQQRLAEARTLLETLVDPSAEGHSMPRARLLLRLSQVARAQGDNETALNTMQAARDTDTSNRAILVQLAVLAEELEAWSVAENALTSVLLLKGPEIMPRGEALLRRARVAIHHSGAKRALLWARKALEAAPDSEEAALLIAQLEGQIA